MRPISTDTYPSTCRERRLEEQKRRREQRLRGLGVVVVAVAVGKVCSGLEPVGASVIMCGGQVGEKGGAFRLEDDGCGKHEGKAAPCGELPA